ncbi:hypothetical protein AX660_17215 [Paraglaciecola hydrolytica]|uniref:Uncharacterized protein n=1 Tax=Paraglaciecola hydrolytica TaxID=1799789 RepID=A0A135ZYS0_9ALTE|nr:hypothetical protein AX660_17215 [Paraglaciecola hydrolytica]
MAAVYCMVIQLQMKYEIKSDLVSKFYSCYTVMRLSEPDRYSQIIYSSQKGVILLLRRRLPASVLCKVLTITD